MHNKITRRKFIKWAAIVGGAISVSSFFSVGGKAVLDKRKRAKKLAANTKERLVESNRWFTPRECVLISALAALIVPKDETGPGASDIDIVDALERVVEKSQNRYIQDRHILYRKGLDAFDKVAQREYGSVFAKLTCEQQISILKSLDKAFIKLPAYYTLLDRIRRKAKKIYYKYKLNGFGETIDLFPVLVNDVMECFYTSQVAWNGLGYDGPPMPNGYLGRLSECEQNW